VEPPELFIVGAGSLYCLTKYNEIAQVVVGAGGGHLLFLLKKCRELKNVEN
jgi:hypothetical protein